VSQTRAVVRPLAGGKKAVKHLDAAGQVEYLILDAHDRECEAPAKSLDELLRRYPLPS